MEGTDAYGWAFTSDDMPDVTVSPDKMVALGIGINSLELTPSLLNVSNDQKTKQFRLRLRVDVVVDPSIFGFSGTTSTAFTIDLGDHSITAGEGETADEGESE